MKRIKKEISKLKIVNVIRAIEVVLLMKGSEAATERAFSDVKTAVLGRFDKKTKKPEENDLVAKLLFMKRNSSLIDFDFNLARIKFVEKGNKEALMKTKPATTKSLTVKRLLNRTKVKKRSKKVVSVDIIDDEEEIDDPGSFIIDDPLQESNIDNDLQDLNACKLSDLPRPPNTTETFDDSQSISTGNMPTIDDDLGLLKDIYCFCNTDKNDDFVGCDKSKSCLSYKKRLSETGCHGGDWFHASCIGLTSSLRPTDSWFCDLCHPQSNLLTHLFNEDREIIKVSPDGNCLYRCLSIFSFGTPNKHRYIRDNINDTLKKLFFSEKYSKKWVTQELDTDLFLRTTDEKLVRHIAKYNFMSFDLPKNEIEITEDMRSKYLQSKSQPARKSDSIEIIRSRYGTEIEIMLYSYIEKKSVWILEVNNSTKPTYYKWHLAASYFGKNDYYENVKSKNYCCLLYSNPSGNSDYAHYDAIINKKQSLPPPFDDVTYSIKSRT